MERNYHTNNAMKLAVQQLSRIPIEENDKAFRRFMQHYTDDEKLKILWNMTQLTIKAIIFGMRSGYSMTIPGIVCFKVEKTSNYIREIRRKMKFLDNATIKQMISERLKKVTILRKRYIPNE